ncbi:MAG TPA: beta keto-acyl synthase, partial [Cyanobacteria bacterium UBA11148]|nr:beta keto-acyl synthase [Cyanobacteria bacterium UBA11148]
LHPLPNPLPNPLPFIKKPLMKSAIAIVGMACHYPDAHSPLELWENILAQRQAFRRLPPERLNLADYFSADRTTPDRTYAAQAALIEGYEFDRVGFRVPNSTFGSADLAHWLALDMAAKALSDAGFPDGEGLPHDMTGVLVGNTLTGEFSRANVMRLRWPYVRRIVEAELIKKDWTREQCNSFLENLETRYKSPFPEVGEETLAGGLSNTIAGRICNYFNLKGGGYTLDGACSSSLLAIANSCSALVAGDLDVALAGGVDLSLDPFELVGFAKTGALAPEEMRVYDIRSAGFWPGEGCGFIVLMRYDDAIAQGRRIYAVIRGWGISSDGNGGITRPEVEGQLLALHRAYHRAGFTPNTVAYFEGHGTGTSVGDTTELRALSHAINQSQTHTKLGSNIAVETDAEKMNATWYNIPPTTHPLHPLPNPLPTLAAIGSVKANIGHTKAAAGIAGLIKATMAVYTKILPPTTGCQQPHPELTTETPALRVLEQGEVWSANYPLRAGVSAMGFGGINTHIVLEGVANRPTHGRDVTSRDVTSRDVTCNVSTRLMSSTQDAELLLLGATNAENLQQQVNHLLTLAPKLSRAEVIDLAAQLAKTLNTGLVRAALVVSNPQELTTRLETLKSWLEHGLTERLDSALGVFLGKGTNTPRIGFLFPGQASPTYLAGGVWSRRFSWVRQLYEKANLPVNDNNIHTAIAQPAIITASIAGLQTLEKFGVKGAITVGHSLGELAALHWGGAFDENALLRIAKVRGQAMGELGHPSGTMASLGTDRQTVAALLNGDRVAIAGLNSPRQTIISGEATAVTTIVNRARSQGLKAITLPVSHAFHSPLVAAAIQPLANYLSQETFLPLQRSVVSTVTGTLLTAHEDLRSLLCTQVTSPVQFIDAVTEASPNIDLWIEVGSGQVLSRLVSDFVNTPIIPLDASGSSLKGLLNAIGAAFVLGTPINSKALFANRFTKPFNLDWHPKFFVNPCEKGRGGEGDGERGRWGDGEMGKISSPHSQTTFRCTNTPSLPTDSALDIVRQLVAERTELPVSAIAPETRLLSDLHLNSITVGQLVVEAAKRLKLSPPVAPTDYANATISEVVQALEELVSTGHLESENEEQQLPSGVDAWIRTFTVEFVERPLSYRVLPSTSATGQWQIFAPNNSPLATLLQQAFDDWGNGGGVVVCLPPEPDERHLNLLLSGAKAVLAEKQATRFVLVQQGGGGAAFARTLHLEVPNLTTCVVDLPQDRPQAAGWILAEAKAAVGYVEAHYDISGVRREPILRLFPLSRNVSFNLSTSASKTPNPQTQTPNPKSNFNISTLVSPIPNPKSKIPNPKSEIPKSEIPNLKSKDVLLVTGGGKGIAAESAISLAKETGIRLALMGRSKPETDPELAANLERMKAANIEFQYVAGDVTNGSAVREAIAQFEAKFGTITAILHGAGTNVPQLLTSLDEKAFQRTLAPKVPGLRNILAAINPHQLRLLITFGSIIARTGLRGEADYALANEWLTQLTERFGQNYPNCHCLTIEWSVWSGVGMGERLGRIDALMREGITPIPPNRGISILHNLILQSLTETCNQTPEFTSTNPIENQKSISAVAQSAIQNRLTSNAVIVTGRFGEVPTLKLEKPELPFLRFLEKPRVYYPGIELVVEAELSTENDPYLNDHIYEGDRIFPGVMGLEAMAQVAIALLETSQTKQQKTNNKQP